eukprot:1191148-Prorocentrum_minimum.AAC.3
MPRETGSSSPSPSARTAARTVAPKSPPWNPTPGARIQGSGATLRIATISFGAVAPTTIPQLPYFSFHLYETQGFIWRYEDGEKTPFHLQTDNRHIAV